MTTPTQDLHQLAIRRLLDAADAQERGDLGSIEEGFEEFEARVPADATASLATVLRFWDGWIDSRNHEWQYYEPIAEADWPGLAREIVANLSSGSDITNELLLRQFGPESERTRIE